MRTYAVALPVLGSVAQAYLNCDWECNHRFGQGFIGYVMGTAPFCGGDCTDCQEHDFCGPLAAEFNDGGNYCVTGSKQCCCKKLSGMAALEETADNSSSKPLQTDSDSVNSSMISSSGRTEDAKAVNSVPEVPALTVEETVAASNCNDFCNSKGIKYGYVRGTAPVCGADANDCCAHDYPGMQASAFSDGGQSCWTGTKQCCCGTPAGQSSCPKPGPSDLSCNIISGVCNIIAKKAMTSVVGCTELAAEGAGICLAVGLGPEDPWADVCAVVIATSIETGCNEAIKQWGKFGASECTKAANCAVSSALLDNRTIDTSIVV